ncbi:unnamed protein product [Darwinula stevensoni]|uniref:Sushi domain-containing protein n=1 Tax=Darwinula stevensoni TaxID=69355 RepID=A0A7R9AG47_9CRUS|nr:unnamed protein product [Darwinula stevensoni]CAG0903560.1 unnamed protein product [Darwinula stevensoni]
MVGSGLIGVDALFWIQFGNPLGRIRGKNNTECIRRGKYAVGSVVRYACNQYYVLRGSHVRTCTKTGQWTGPAPFCEPECGRKGKPVKLSAGGKPSDTGEWPWQVALYDVAKRELVCGGALIREKWVTSWGFNGSDLLTATLTEVELPVISNVHCRRDTIRLTGDHTVTRTLTSNMFCAGHDEDTPLERSPMVFPSHASPGRPWQVEGIVSHFFDGDKCSSRRPGHYSIFTKVNRFIRWIERKMWENPS